MEMLLDEDELPLLFGEMVASMTEVEGLQLVNVAPCVSRGRLTAFDGTFILLLWPIKSADFIL